MSLLNLTIPEYCDLTKKHKLKSFVLMPQASEFTAALAHNRMGFSNEMVSSESDSGSCIDASMIDRDNRFVAGAKFFNYKQLGALREGGEVSLFSKDHHGLLAAAFAFSSVYAMLRYCVRPALPSTLGIHLIESPFGPFCLVSLPTSLSFFFGLLSDCVPIATYRRKSYMIIGFVIAAFALFGLTILSAAVYAKKLSSKKTGPHFMYVFMTLIPVCIAGIVLLKVASEARIIELSQREPLRTRGSILINFLIFRTLVECFCTWITAAVLEYDAITKALSTRIHSTWIYGTLCIICLAGIPIIIYRTEEDAVHGNNYDRRYSEPDFSNIRGQNIKRFFRMCHQRALWQVALFLAFAMATTSFKFGNAEYVLRTLVEYKRSAEMYVIGGRAMMKLAVMLAWKNWWMNNSWRWFVLYGFLFAASVDLIRSLLVIYVGAVREEMFYYSVQILTGIPDAILCILAPVAAVELAESGLEGATSGLFQSFRSIFSITTRALCQRMDNGVSVLRSVSAHTIPKLALLLCTAALINGISTVAIPLLPQQRLDAQQLRAFGGYTRSAPVVLYFTFFATFFLVLGLSIEAITHMVHSSLARQ